MLIKLSEMKDPIEQAAFIWWEIVRIHISSDANKRTGKALASIILLQNGYLPPLITQEDEDLYIDTFINNFDKKDGFENFKQFVVNMIIKTQEHFKGQLL